MVLIIVIAIVVILSVLGLAANQMYVKQARNQLHSGKGEDAAEMTEEMRDMAAGKALRVKPR